MSDQMTKLKIPKTLFREGAVEMVGEGENKRLRISISSDVPYERFDWWNEQAYFEVLDHSRDGVDLSRLRNGAALLYNHDRNIMLGTLSNPVIENGRCYVEARISNAPDVESYRVKIEEGILKDTSIGYTLLDDGEEVGERDGKPVYKFRFAIHEASLVTIPADTTVGVGRERQKPEGEPAEIRVRMKNSVDGEPEKSQKRTTPTKTMPDQTTQTGSETEERTEVSVTSEQLDAALSRELKRRDDIEKVQAQFERLGATKEDAQVFIGDKTKTADNFKTWLMDNRIKSTTPSQASERPQHKIGMSSKERGRFSMCKAILETALQYAGQGKGPTGIEKEAMDAARDLSQKDPAREFSGLCIPDDILTARFDEDRDLNSRAMANVADEVRAMAVAFQRSMLVTSFANGGALVGTDLLGGSLIDILRNAVLIGQGPMAITELGGLVGNVAIPKQTSTTTVYWLAEGASVTESSAQFAQLVLTPHRMSVDTSYTKQLLAQASISVEAFVRSDQALAMAVEEDRVTINGTGLNGEPLGILFTSGVGADVTFSGAATWADMVALEYGLENANVRTGQQAIITSPLTKSYLKQTTQVAASTFPIYLWMPAKGEFPIINGVMPGIVNEYPAYATKNVTTNVMIQGIFQNIIKGRWAGFDVVVDPYSLKKTEQIEITVNQWIDVGLRYPQAFEATTDAPTAP